MAVFLTIDCYSFDGAIKLNDSFVYYDYINIILFEFEVDPFDFLNLALDLCDYDTLDNLSYSYCKYCFEKINLSKLSDYERKCFAVLSFVCINSKDIVSKDEKLVDRLKDTYNFIKNKILTNYEIRTL